MKQANAEFALQLPDARAQRRLADPDAGRGAAEVTLVGDGEEVSEVAEVQREGGSGRLSAAIRPAGGRGSWTAESATSRGRSREFEFDRLDVFRLAGVVIEDVLAQDRAHRP